MSTAEGLDKVWLRQVEEQTCAFFERVRDPATVGRYRPCEHGVTEVGRQMGLGFSCFALRTLRMFRRWDNLPASERHLWTGYLQGFQEADGEGAFRDEAELAYARRQPGRLERLLSRLRRRPRPPTERALLLAETKQTVATLAELGAEPARPFTGFPTEPAEVRAWLEALDWSRPWGAGGQSGALVVFLCTQAPRFAEPAQIEISLGICRAFFAGLADPATGAYFRGKRPAHGELINGAMKVLMSLAWLGVTPHHAERLIQTCLEHEPSPRGCHLVDAIYVLHQSQPGEAGPALRRYCLRVLELIRAHYHPGGGFSFYVGHAQDSYYGIPITRGRNEPDLQGTCLLVWALAMIWRLVEPAHARWQIIKP